MSIKDLFSGPTNATVGPWGVGKGYSGSPALVGGDGSILAIFKKTEQGRHDLALAANAPTLVVMINELCAHLDVAAASNNESARGVIRRAFALVEEEQE